MTIKLWQLIVVEVVVVGAVTAVVALVLFGHSGAAAGGGTNAGAADPRITPGQKALQIAALALRAALPSIEAYHYGYNTYRGVTISKLRSMNPKLDPNLKVVIHGSTFCLEDTVEGVTGRIVGSDTTALARGKCR
jgi:hypothetical protein